MKKLLILFLLVPFLGRAQIYGPDNKFGTEHNRSNNLYNLGIPRDTFSVPVAKQSFPHIAAKTDTIYLWDTAAKYWKFYSPGSTIDTSNKWVNTIYRIAGKDSIFFQIGSTVYAILDSTGGGGTQDLASVTGYGNTTTDTIQAYGFNMWDGAAADWARLFTADGSLTYKSYLGYLGNFDFTTLTTDRSWVMPNANGTVMLNPLTTTGDIIYSSSGTTASRLTVGTNGQLIRSNGTTPEWFTPSYVTTRDRFGYSGEDMTQAENRTVTASGKYTFAMDSVWRIRLYTSRNNASDSAFMIYPSATSGGVPLMKVSATTNYTYVNNLDVYAQTNFGGATYIDASGVLRFVNSSGYVTFQGGSYQESYQQTTVFSSNYLNVPSGNVGWRFNNTTNGVPSTSDTANYANLDVGFTSPVSSAYRSLFKVTSKGVRLSNHPSTAQAYVLMADASGNVNIVDTTGLFGSGGGGSGITIGTTTITSGTNTRVLYNNSGVVGEYTISGTGNVIMSTDASFSTGISFGTNTKLTGNTVFYATGDVGIKLWTSSTGTTNTDGFNFGIDNATKDVYLNQRENALIYFYVNGGEALRLNTNQTVGIQTSAYIATSSGGLGVGTSTISAKANILSTTEQLRVLYDASNYYSTTVSSTGGVTFNAVGSGSKFTFSDAITGIFQPVTTFTTSASSLTPDFTANEGYGYTALAANLTINAPTGTPANGQTWWIYIKDDGTSRTLSWNAAYVASGITLPASTTTGKGMRVGGYYANSVLYADFLSIEN